MSGEQTSAWLDEIDQLRKAATPVPWVQWDAAVVNPRTPVHDVFVECDFRADAALIVAAVNAMPRLVAAVRAALDLHSPADRGTGPQCQGCATHVTFTPWPCETHAEIAAALAAGRPDGTAEKAGQR